MVSQHLMQVTNRLANFANRFSLSENIVQDTTNKKIKCYGVESNQITSLRGEGCWQQTSEWNVL